MIGSRSWLASVLLHGAALGALWIWTPCGRGGELPRLPAPVEIRVAGDPSPTAPEVVLRAHEVEPLAQADPPEDPLPEPLQQEPEIPAPEAALPFDLAATPVVAPEVPVLPVRELPVLRSARPPSEPPQPAPSAPSAPEEASVVPPRPADQPPPEYPREARRRGWEGRVRVWCAVDADGRVREVRLAESSGYAVLDEAAMRAVRRWRFLPARQGGRAVPGEIIVPFRFVLTD
jgi:protein TonB